MTVDADDDESGFSISWPQLAAAALMAGGIAAVVLSFMTTAIVDPHGGWSKEQAHQYQAAAIKLHALSHEMGEKAHEGKAGEVKAQHDKAKAEYDALRSELDSATARPRLMSWLLRILGVVLLGSGAIWMRRTASPPAVRA